MLGSVDFGIFVEKMLIEGGILNLPFHAEMKSRFGMKYIGARLKKKDRIIEKSSTAFRLKPFPTSATCPDVVRGTIYFDSIEQLLTDYKRLAQDVRNGNAGMIEEIIWIKNYFKIGMKFDKYYN